MKRTIVPGTLLAVGGLSIAVTAVQQPLLDAIRKVTDRPVTMIVNTHTQGDHVSGNVEFPVEAGIVAIFNETK
jgi:glyoxylase-like metal-dependent hydrolase (beta-lactamase superfamily II)